MGDLIGAAVTREQLRGKQGRHYVDYQLREVEGTESGRWLTGRAVPYNTWTDTGWYHERIAPGAFAKSIREAAAGLPLLLFHESGWFPIGISTEWREEEGGLHGLWRLDEEDPIAVTAARKAHGGFLTGLSVGFLPIENLERSAGGDLVDVNNPLTVDEFGVPWVTRREARLLETSLTPTPAYVGAEVLATRALERAAGAREVQAAQEERGRPRAERLAALLEGVRL